MTEGFFEHQEEHSRIKAQIVSKYVPAWARVMIPRSSPVVYLDLFSGPGRYEDGSPSTPLLVAQAVAADATFSRHVKLVFNDADPSQSKRLRSELSSVVGLDRLRYPPFVVSEEVGPALEKQFEGVVSAPTFSFVDPFGFKGLTVNLIRELVRSWGCEVLFFFNYAVVRRAVMNPHMRVHMERLFGEEHLAALQAKWGDLSQAEREVEVLDHLRGGLKDAGGVFVLPFRFRPAGVEKSYHLIFVTKNVLGYKIMKDVQRGLATDAGEVAGSYEYVPADFHYPTLFALTALPSQLEEILPRAFAGRTLSVEKVFWEHHVDTPFVLRDYKSALLQLISKGKVGRNDGGKRRRPGTLADDVIIVFPPRHGQR